MATAPEINLTIPLDQVNVMLQLLGTHPFNQVADILMNVRSQANRQVQQLQQQDQQGPTLLRPNGGEAPRPVA